jgi:glycosyltransferase involved in cell wall biosynthesis
MESGEHRPRVVVAAEWFPPAFRAGGPIRSVANLVEVLGETHDVWVVAGAYDLGQTEPLPGLPLNEWIERPWGHVMYLTRDRWTRGLWRQLILQQLRPDYLYLNSLFARFFAQAPLHVARKRSETQVVVAPRGMLGSGALEIKPLKKRVFLAVAFGLKWFHGVRWHASTSMEEGEIRAQFPKAEVFIAQNLPSLPSAPPSNERLNEGPLVLAVLGRIQEKKNIHFGLKVLAEALHTSQNPPEVTVQLIGPAESEEYLQMLLNQPGRPHALRVEHLGARTPDQVSELLGCVHFLLMPTRHENFGHAIVEAWSHGCPVLLSDQTPWRDLERKQLGWDWKLDERTWVEGLNQVLAMDREEWNRWSVAAAQYFNAVVRSPEILDANRRIFSA